jgi:hypothetical protein
MSTILEPLKPQGLKLWCRGHLEWHDLPAEFHETYQLLVTSSEHMDTDGQTTDLISLSFIC